jgi:hypothetical protein
MQLAGSCAATEIGGTGETPVATQRKALLAAILKSSFCGRFNGHWNDSGSDAGVAWGIIQAMLKEKHVLNE